jgi:general secretion pathway protein A
VYLQYFNLREEPFNITPDPRFLFGTEQHEAALESLLYGISNGKGFGMLTGEIGTGKTTVCRALLNRLDANTDVSVILNPLLSVGGLIRAINDDFGNPIASERVEYQLAGLNKYLLDRADKRKNALVLIDEAQNLSIEALEMTRLLSNLETDRRKLLQIVLVGQPELETTLQSHQLRQLNQRISVRQRLGALSQRQLRDYIYHRISIAGGGGHLTFEPSAIAKIHAHTKGFPRLTNILCDRSLLAAYAKRTRRIDKHTVKEAIKDINGKQKAWWRIW